MGLSVHFKLVASPDTDAVRARELVRAMRRRAKGFRRRGRVDDVLGIGHDPEALHWANDEADYWPSRSLALLRNN